MTRTAPHASSVPTQPATPPSDRPDIAPPAGGGRPDRIDVLAGLGAAQAVAILRGTRATVREDTKASYESLVEATVHAGLGAADLDLAALRVAALQQAPAPAAWHGNGAWARGAHA